MHDKASTQPKKRHNCIGPKLSRPEWGNMRCSKCGRDNREGRKFCTSCGTPLAAATCPKCGAPIQPDESFCGDCGTALAASNTTAQSSTFSLDKTEITISAEAGTSAVAEGERKTVT